MMCDSKEVGVFPFACLGEVELMLEKPKRDCAHYVTPQVTVRNSGADVLYTVEERLE